MENYFMLSSRAKNGEIRNFVGITMYVDNFIEFNFLWNIQIGLLTMNSIYHFKDVWSSVL